MLIRLGELGDDYVLGPKCDHRVTDGRWLVLKDNEIFMFDPSTQMQKDVWLSEGKDKGGEEEHERRIKMLRWLCYRCNNIQEP